METIAQIESNDRRLKTLFSAIKAAEMIEALSEEGPFTMFAPAEDAFRKLPKGTLQGLLENTAQLEQVLLRHLVPGRLLAGDLIDLKQIKTAEGNIINIKTEGDVVMVNDARMIIADIEASNGVIHVIDAVLTPLVWSEA